MIEYKDIIKTPPLPFLGNKRSALKHLYNEFKNIELDEDLIIVDAFGGSGLLSNFFKQLFPKNRVIYNDFDGYTERLKKYEATENFYYNLVEKLNEIKKLEVINGYRPKLTKDQAKVLVEEIEKADEEKIDKETIISKFMMRGQVMKRNLKVDHAYYYKTKTFTPYSKDYLKGVEVVRKDGIELINEYKDKKALFLLDPPYTHTTTVTYKGELSLYDFILLYEDLLKNNSKFILFYAENSSMYDIVKYFNKSKKSEVREGQLKGKKEIIDYYI